MAAVYKTADKSQQEKAQFFYIKTNWYYLEMSVLCGKSFCDYYLQTVIDVA